jgi:hypothetical protein
MIFIPAWVSNVLLLITCCLCGYQHTQLGRPNPVMNIQFLMIVFCAVMIMITAIYAHTNAWLSLAFMLIAFGCLGFIVHRHRMLPPNKSFE